MRSLSPMAADCAVARTPAPACTWSCYTGKMPHRSMVTALVIDVPGDVHADEVAFWSVLRRAGAAR
jgi:hypothetical protein